jgi:hypothetical protein
MAEIPALPADLVTDLELLLAYSPSEGRLYRTDAAGTPIRELKLWHWHEAKGRCEINSINVEGKSKQATHIIFRVIIGRWPYAGMMIDHRDRDPSNNTFVNLREVTPAQNSRNADHSGQRWNGTDEVLEQCVQKRAAGYVVVVKDIYIGIYQSSVEANQVARQVRRELYGEFALAPVTSRRMIRGSAP